MAHQIFLLSLRAGAQDDDAVRDELAETVNRVGGFMLLAAGDSCLIAAFDEQWLAYFRQHRAVEFCGALQLDPNGKATDRLRQLFAANVAAQLASRGAGESAGQSPAGPRHRPLVWHRSAAAKHAANSTGISISTNPIARGLT